MHRTHLYLPVCGSIDAEYPLSAACCLLLPDCLFDWLPGWVASVSWLYRPRWILNVAHSTLKILPAFQQIFLFHCLLKILCIWHAGCVEATKVILRTLYSDLTAPRLCAVCLCIRLCKMDLLLGMHNFSSSTQVLHSIAHSPIHCALLFCASLDLSCKRRTLTNLLAAPHCSVFFQINSLFYHFYFRLLSISLPFSKFGFCFAFGQLTLTVCCAIFSNFFFSLCSA